MIAAACKANEHLSWSESIPIMLLVAGITFVLWMLIRKM